MKRFSEQFNKQAKNIRLNTAEKSSLRERLISYMEYHPLAGDVKAVTSVQATDGREFFILNIGKWRLARWSSSLVLLLLVSVSYFAEQAVPGDTLYSMKVGFNEEVRGSITLGSYEKVVWETERLNRRIAEARLLADEGRLTEEVEASVAFAVKTHTENARKEIANLKLSDEDEATLASIGLNTALDVQTSSFLRKRNDGEVGVNSTKLIEAALNETQAAELATQGTLPAYSRILAKVESETTRAYELLKGINNYATKVEGEEIGGRLIDIETKIASAMNLSESDEEQAKKDLVVALQQTQKLIAFMTNIDVRQNLTVEDLVPDILTVQERIALVSDQVKKTEILLSNISLALAETPAQTIVLATSTASTTATSTATATKITPDTKEKLTLGFKQSKKALEKTKLELAEVTDIIVLEQSSLEAYSLAVDISAALALPTEITVPKEIEVQPEVIPEAATSTVETEQEEEIEV